MCLNDISISLGVTGFPSNVLQVESDTTFKWSNLIVFSAVVTFWELSNNSWNNWFPYFKVIPRSNTNISWDNLHSTWASYAKFTDVTNCSEPRTAKQLGKLHDSQAKKCLCVVLLCSIPIVIIVSCCLQCGKTHDKSSSWVVWNIAGLWLSIQLGMSSSQLTNSLHHFSGLVAQPQTRLWLTIIDHIITIY